MDVEGDAQAAFRMKDGRVERGSRPSVLKETGETPVPHFQQLPRLE
jgi:hypothetical protein